MKRRMTRRINADDRLREAQRLAKQGDVEAKARYVAELVRSGKLPTRRVYLAERLNNAEAELVVGQQPLDFSQGQAWEDIFYVVLRELSGEETQEFLRQWILEKIDLWENFASERKWLKPYLKKRSYPRNLTRIADIYNYTSVTQGVLVWYWYQPPQYRSGDDLIRACGELSRALASTRDGWVNERADALSNFLLYGNIYGP